MPQYEAKLCPSISVPYDLARATGETIRESVCAIAWNAPPGLTNVRVEQITQAYVAVSYADVAGRKLEFVPWSNITHFFFELVNT